RDLYETRVGVGMTITNHPLHISRRALLTHPARALGDDAKSSQTMRVMDRSWWQPFADQAVHPLPRKSLFPAPHNSGPLWLAISLTNDSFIHHNLPVYPGAQGEFKCPLHISICRPALRSISRKNCSRKSRSSFTTRT